MQIDIGNPLLLVGGLCLLCVVGVGLLFGAQLFASFFQVFGSLFEVVTGFISGGPGLWCGCVILLLFLGACAFFVGLTLIALQACGTPEATNLCTLFGR